MSGDWIVCEYVNVVGVVLECLSGVWVVHEYVSGECVTCECV